MPTKLHIGRSDSEDNEKFDVRIERSGPAGGTHLFITMKKTGPFQREMVFPHCAWVELRGILDDLKKTVRGGDYFLFCERRLRVSLK